LVVPVVLLGVLLVGVLSVRYAGEGEAGRIDRALAGLVPMHHGVLAVVGEALADLGDPIPIAVLLAGLAAAAWWWRGGRALALVVVAPSAAMVTTSLVLKPMVQRTRGGSLAFPSGHTTAVAAVAATAAVLVLGAPALAVRVRRLAAAGLALLVVVVGVCLVGRGYHYPTDVLGALGVIAAVVPPAALAVDAFADLGDDGTTPVAPDEAPTRRLPAVR
jgi:undecaprenyl-diphosphatase